jgi:hypothetical protein
MLFELCMACIVDDLESRVACGEGRGDKGIARSPQIGFTTMRLHLARAFLKLGCGGRLGWRTCSRSPQHGCEIRRCRLGVGFNPMAALALLAKVCTNSCLCIKRST